MRAVCVCVLFFYIINSIQCIMWNLEPNTRKCLKEELQKNVLITGEFEVSEAPGQKIDYVVCILNSLGFNYYL